MASDVFAHEMLDEQEVPALLNHSSMSGMDHTGEYNDNDVIMEDVEAVVYPEPVWVPNTTLRVPNLGDEELPPMVEGYMSPDCFMESEEQACEAEMMERFPVVYSPEMMSISIAQRFYNLYGCQFIQRINEAEREGRRKVEERKQEDEEEGLIRKRIEELQKEIEQHNSQIASLEEKSKKKIAEYDKRMEKARDSLKNTTRSLKKAKDNESNWQQKIRDTNKWYIAGSKLRAQIDEWMKSHGIKIVIPDSGDSQDEASVSDSEFILIINSVHPEFPEKEYKIRLQHIEQDSASPMFDALSVYPTFEGAFEVLQAANESQNFTKLLVDCKNGWKKECHNESPKCNGFGKGEQTAPLFDSPESTVSSGST